MGIKFKVLRKVFFFLLFFLLIANSFLLSQDNIKISREYLNALIHQTRALDGNPGIFYWQNHSQYKIDANISVSQKILSGKENVIYFNNSPDTLKEIYIRLYQNFNKPTSSRDWVYDQKSITDGVILNKISIGDEEIDKEKRTETSGTNLKIKLDKPLLPKSNTELYFDWSFKIPEGDNPRMGIYDASTFFIAYWYPQIAVYDDIDGWDKVDYKGTVEFYNDFSDFDVNISVDDPTAFVWATGLLQNPDDIFSKKNSEIFKKTSEEITNFISSKNINDKDFYRSDRKPFHYKAENVPDFAFSLSDHYYWDFIDYEVEPGRKVRINTAYNPNSKDFYQVCNIAKETIKYLSDEFPEVPYPYPSMTVFNGEGGMEFPMMVNNGSEDKYSSTVYLTSHEISHTYFPFYMGINERKYAWMDEGWAVYLPQEFQTRNGEGMDSKARTVQNYLNMAGTSYDLPLMILSHQLRSPAYRVSSYQKAASVYDLLKNVLGNDIFKNALKEYIREWNGKHPTPYDFFSVFNSVSGENLDWLWKPWFFEISYADLSIKEVNYEQGVIRIKIENTGGLPLPIYISLKDKDNNELLSISETAKVWSNGDKVIEVIKDIDKIISYIELGNKYIPDINKENNKIFLNN